MDNMKFRSARDLFLSFKDDNDFSFSAPINVDLIANKLGIYVERFMDFENYDIIGKIYVNNGIPTIMVNELQNSYEPRRRFTIAHELGHFCLHLSEFSNKFIDTKQSMSRSESYWDKYESEANTFAAELLMPVELIAQEVNKVMSLLKETNGYENISLENFIEYMSRLFIVSSISMKYRLNNLGLITA
jgi:Zn-dependent peptidase ImmA (M78 family)